MAAPSSKRFSALTSRLWIAPLVVAGVWLFLWWLGWKPGILSVDSVRQWSEVVSGDFTNTVPATHTITMWLVSRVWRSPAIITLLQPALVILLLALYMRAAARLGVPRWLSGIAVLAVGFLPATSSVIVSLDVHVAQGIASLWLFVEAAGIATAPGRVLAERGNAIRFGVALGTVWLLSHSGVVVVAIVLAALAVGVRRHPRLLVVPGLTALGLWLIVQGPVFAIAGVDRTVPPLGEVYAPEVAAVLVNHPDAFGPDDIALLERVADLDVWASAYECGDGETLVGDRDFDVAAIRSDPGDYRGLLVRTAFHHPWTVLGHRLCAAGVLFLPPQPEGERYETYTYIVPPNTLGLERETVWGRAFNMTKALLVRVDQPWHRWLFWRPGLLVLPGLALAALAAVRSMRRLLFPGVVFLAVLFAEVLTIRASSSVAVFPVYLLALAWLPFWWVAARRHP